MANKQQDTEITLGTGRMLALFFSLVTICAGFFAIGFSLGRKANTPGGNILTAQAGAPSAVVRPSAGKNTTPPAPASDNFTFYKAVEQKNADSKLATPESQTQPAASSESPKSDDSSPGTAAPTNSYYVQVAAVTRQEDADALVEALKKKQYPAFTASNPTVDKFFRVQVGPYADVKDAELTRSHLVADGYNPILKK
jgi:DedD protein